MNRLEKLAWSRLFCEWFIHRGNVLDQCYETMHTNGHEIAVCPHMTYHAGTRNEGTDGTFEQYTCAAYLDSLDGVSDDDCRLAYLWMKDNCPAWETYIDRFFNEWLGEIYEGEA